MSIEEQLAREAAKDAYADAHLYKDPSRLESIILAVIKRAVAIEREIQKESL